MRFQINSNGFSSFGYKVFVWANHCTQKPTFNDQGGSTKHKHLRVFRGMGSTEQHF